MINCKKKITGKNQLMTVKSPVSHTGSQTQPNDR